MFNTKLQLQEKKGISTSEFLTTEEHFICFYFILHYDVCVSWPKRG